MATQSEFINTPVAVLNRSAFNKSFQNLLSLKVGTLTPVLVDELVPDTTIDLRAAALAKLPPLASDTFMRVKMHLEAFFVPYRVLYGGFAHAYAHQKITSTGKIAVMPYLNFNAGAGTIIGNAVASGTLADYLGFKLPVGASFTNSTTFKLNLMPFLAYHRIFDDYFRNPLVQVPVFVPPTNDLSVTDYGNRVRNLPFATQYYGNASSQSVGGGAYGINYLYTGAGSPIYNNSGCDLNDGVKITDLRQRNFGHDYFTSASPSPTVGTMPTLVVDSTVSGSTATGAFTIGALRSINSLTQFAERNALAGTRYSDFLKANYGVELSEQIEGRSQYLGRMVFDVYSKGVSQTGVSASSGDVSTQNPFKTVGAQYGDAVGAGEDTLCSNFYVREPGLLMVIASLVPRPTYSTGMNRYLRHFTTDGWRGDIANQILENVGPQPIYKSELDGAVIYSANPDDVFGYTDRFAEYKTKFDEIHGLLRDGGSLESFALQRSVGLAGASLNSSFIQIPTNFLDQVAAVSGDISSYGCWMDVAFDYKVVQPLSRYSQPSLVMPAEHGSQGHTETIKRSGSYL